MESDPRIGKLPPAERTIDIRPHGPVGLGTVAQVMLKKYPKRTVLGLAMIMSQAFLYNGVSFTFALILANFYKIPSPASASTFCRSPSATSLARSSWAGSLTRSGASR